MNWFSGSAKYFNYSMILGLALLFAFQNCGQKLSSINDTEVITYEAASLSGIGCVFNGVDVAEGERVIAFLSATSTETNPCVEQEQICENGSLRAAGNQPLYRFPQCRPVGSASCAYEVTGKPAVYISHNSHAKFYSQNEVDLDESCDSFAMPRYCSNGSFKGDLNFRFTSCIRRQPVDCVEGSTVVAHRMSADFAQSASVAYNENCIIEKRTCYNGSLSGSYTIPAVQCTKRVAKSCLLSGVTIPHGEKKPFFKTANVPFGERCVPKDRDCTDGNIGGDAEYVLKDCVPQNPNNCTFDTVTVQHDRSVPAYKSKMTPANLACDDSSNMVQRKCFNGVMDPTLSSYPHSSCQRDVPVGCTTADGQTIESGTTPTLYKTTNMYPPQTCTDNANSEVVSCTNGVFSVGTTARLKNCAPTTVLNPSLPADGVGGGNPFNFMCPNRTLAVGFHGRSGDDVDAIGLLCENGYRSAETAGGGGGYFNLICPAGQFLVGAYVAWPNEDFRTLRAVCAQKNGSGLSQSSHQGEVIPELYGSRQVCPPGYVVYRIEGSHSDRVHKLKLHCARVAEPINVNCRGEWVDLLCPNGYDSALNKERFRIIQPKGGTGAACEASNNSVRDMPGVFCTYQNDGGG